MTDDPLVRAEDWLEAGLPPVDITKRLLRDLVTEVRDLRASLQLILAEPHGCPMCDSGKLRDPDKEHWDRCGFAKAAALVR